MNLKVFFSDKHKRFNQPYAAVSLPYSMHMYASELIIYSAYSNHFSFFTENLLSFQLSLSLFMSCDGNFESVVNF